MQISEPHLKSIVQLLDFASRTLHTIIISDTKVFCFYYQIYVYYFYDVLLPITKSDIFIFGDRVQIMLRQLKLCNTIQIV